MHALLLRGTFLGLIACLVGCSDEEARKPGTGGGGGGGSGGTAADASPRVDAATTIIDAATVDATVTDADPNAPDATVPDANVVDPF